LLATPIVAATAALHEAGYVHRDLKPENAIAAPDGTITVIDLGLAWRDGMTRHTDTGAAVGSVGYMAPEQIEGGKVGGAADVWALGVMLYELVAGKRPFARARPAEEAAAALLGSHPRLSAADRRADDELATLVSRCIALDPAMRPTASELARALEARIDWAETVAVERAAAVADPPGYQARVAPFRVRRLERLARAALDAGAPFEALAHCDRGLAYAPDHAGLLALVADAEAATATRPAPIADAPSAPISMPAHAISATYSPASRRWWWLVAIAALAIAGAVVRYTVADHVDPGDTWSYEPAVRKPALKILPTENDKAVMRDFVSLFGRAMSMPEQDPNKPHKLTDGDRAMARDFISLFGEMMSSSDASTPSPTAAAGEPSTAEDWLELAKSKMDQPETAIAATERALVLAPHWLDAEMMLCGLEASSKDPRALDSCEAVTARKPQDLTLLAFRSVARANAGKFTEALADADRVVAGDPDPKYRHLRGKLRKEAGDHAGARADFEAACKLGYARACTDTP
jgi:tetratricopeptide (TPR) repeat protein